MSVLHDYHKDVYLKRTLRYVTISAYVYHWSAFGDIKPALRLYLESIADSLSDVERRYSYIDIGDGDYAIRLHLPVRFQSTAIQLVRDLPVRERKIEMRNNGNTVEQLKKLMLTDLYESAFCLARGNKLLGVDSTEPWKPRFHTSTAIFDEVRAHEVDATIPSIILVSDWPDEPVEKEENDIE